jgi:predicted esterase
MSGKAQPGSYINAKHICYIYPLKSHESTVIFLHGLGDAGSGWYEPMQLLQDCLPNTKFVLPTAPRQPVSINNGMVMASWFDIVG